MGLNINSFFEPAKRGLERNITEHKPLTETQASALVDEIIAQGGVPTPEQQEALEGAGYGDVFKPETMH